MFLNKYCSTTNLCLNQHNLYAVQQNFHHIFFKKNVRVCFMEDFFSHINDSLMQNALTIT